MTRFFRKFPAPLILATCAAFCASLSASATHAHSDSQARLHFDAASVKLSDQSIVAAKFDRKATHISWTTDIANIIEYAYDVDITQVSGSIGYNKIYVIDATCPVSTTDDQLRQMFQSLLIDRFGWQAHRGPKDVQGYAVATAKGGIKIQQATPNSAPPPMPSWLPEPYRSYDSTTLAGIEGTVFAVSAENGTLLVIGRNVSMSRFSQYLGRMLNEAVTDRTNLPGHYYLAFEYADPDPSENSGAPSISGALKELGLNLEKYKGPAEVLIIDHINQDPTPN